MQHGTPLRYRAGGEVTLDPRGIAADRLEVEALVVSADAAALALGAERLAAAGLSLAAAIAAPYAAGLAALTREERLAGAIAIDLGAAETGIAAFRHGALVWLAALPCGQAALTDALTHSLRLPAPAAEKLKRRLAALGPATAGAACLEAARFDAAGRLAPAEIRREEIAATIARPLDALFGRIAEALAAASLPRGAERWGVALVGGGAALPGIEALASAALARPVRAGTPAGAVAPAHAACAGAAVWRVDPPPESALGSRARPPRPRDALDRPAGALRQAWAWLCDNF